MDEQQLDHVPGRAELEALGEGRLLQINCITSEDLKGSVTMRLHRSTQPMTLLHCLLQGKQRCTTG
jgi:hypothetical protein